MEEALEKYLRFLVAERNLSPNTLRAYRADLRFFLEFCRRAGVKQPGEIDHRFLRRYLSYLQTMGYSRSTMARRISSVKGFFHFLTERGVIEGDPAAALSRIITPTFAHALVFSMETTRAEISQSPVAALSTK